MFWSLGRPFSIVFWVNPPAHPSSTPRGSKVLRAKALLAALEEGHEVRIRQIQQDPLGPDDVVPAGAGGASGGHENVGLTRGVGSSRKLP